jgi:hypothetical protein
VQKDVTEARLKPELSKLQHYFDDVLGITPQVKPWPEAVELPVFLRQGYSFFAARILCTEVLFAFDRELPLRSPRTIRTQLQQVEAHCGRPVVFVREQLDAFQRKRLIELNTAFVIPGNQMYLPELAIDLREHFRARREIREHVSPATQAALIDLLLRPFGEEQNSTAIGKRLGYTKMTMSRTFNELDALKLVEIQHRGRQRVLIPPENRRQLWTKAEPLLQSPVKSVHYISRLSGVGTIIPTKGLISGLSALSHYTMLETPKTPAVAVTSKRWLQYLNVMPQVEVHPDEYDALTVEVWSYDPALFATPSVVDRLSLYLSLKHVRDERVEMALEEMLEQMPW